MLPRLFALLTVTLIGATEAFAQATAPAPTSPATPGGGAAAPATGIGDYWWLILALLIIAAAIWYFSRRRRGM